VSNFFLQTVPNDLQGAAARADMLWHLQNDRRKEFLDQFVEADGVSLEWSNFFGGNATCPLCYAAITNLRVGLVFVSGVTSVTQGNGVWNSYLGHPLGIGTTDAHPWFDSAAAFLANQVLPRVRSVRKIYFVGHSAGGPICYRLPLLLNPVKPSTMEYWLAAFGSPKPFIPPKADIQGFDLAYNWMLSDDPVALIPPTITGLERFLGGLSATQGRRLVRFHPWQSGASVSLQGEVQPRNTPSDNPTSQATQVGVWLADTTAGRETPHSIGVYRSRLASAVVRYTPTQAIVPLSPPSPPDPPVTLLRVRRMTDIAAQTIFSAAARQNGEFVFLPPQLAFSVKRVGKIFTVYFGDEPVAQAPFKRRARGLARAGNDFCRRLQNEGVVFNQAFLAQFSQYLVAASDPTSGFRPTMNLGG
jgi:hypothetical protein